ncbi:MAG: DUF1772 domain-containing protein [Deltaproteobacteria bacterium]|nr:DUF1772 domain-containing protein [Deltaproteobacteria bacterium]
MFAGNLALAVAAIFAGAAFYVSFAEQPARLELDDRALLAEWKPAYKRGFAMQAPLAIVGFLLGLIAWWLSGRTAFLTGALLMAANWPWTMLVIMPTNKALMATTLEAAGPQSRLLILKWNRLHAVRTILASLAVVAFLIALQTS